MTDNAILIPIDRCPADRNPALVYLGRLTAESSRDTMLGALDTLAGWLTGGEASAVTLAQGWGLLRYQHTAALRAELARAYKPATANKMLSALRGVLKEAWRLGHMSAEDYQRAADIPSIKAETLPAGRDLSADEVGALLQVCAQDDSPAGRRDAAIIAVFWVGLRRAEVSGLDLADYDPASGELRILGKGRKERATYLDAGAQSAVAAWLAVRGSEPGPLFWPINKAGRMTNRTLSKQAIHEVIRRRGLQAGLADFGTHDFRRTAVGDLLEAGVDIVTVSKMMGHADPNTTARYDRRPGQVKRRAANKRRLPYQE